MKLSPSIEALIDGLRHLPGVGPKSAQRMTLHLLERDREGAQQIADAIDDALDARGVLVVLDAVHECVTMRGGRQPDAATLTVAARGAFTDPAQRAELFALLGGPR